MEDKHLESTLLDMLAELEQTNDCVGDTPTRHRISELLVETRKVVKNGYTARRSSAPAFPEVRVRSGDNYNAPIKQYCPGMSLRDYFAAKALQGFVADPDMAGTHVDDVARQAYELADAMLAARGNA